MTTAEIGNIVKEFENDFNVRLSIMHGKRIIYDGKTKVGTSVVVVMPASKIYGKGNGWVDFTKIQIDIFKQHKIAIAAFRLSDGLTYYVDMQSLYPLLTQQNMMENDREGEHWKLDVWPNRIVIRNGGETLYVKPNDKQFISQLVYSKSV
ncbi:MAG: hypothetical protein DRQ35_03195 [Gammaproteobacteria bacterium]|nr:MAG: hypothetical protein DRQ35_03195 [Gammaproteobacteria bacterium]RLA42453.1 MAG: hypothetical protein DRR42_23375 [Gammaproteobacteria bacterium]